MSRHMVSTEMFSNENKIVSYSRRFSTTEEEASNAKNILTETIQDNLTA